MCNIPQIWVLTHANLNSLSRGSWNRTICARHMVCKMITKDSKHHRSEQKIARFRTHYFRDVICIRECSNQAKFNTLQDDNKIVSMRWCDAEHGIPYLAGANPVFWPKGASKIGDSVLWCDVLVCHGVAACDKDQSSGGCPLRRCDLQLDPQVFLGCDDLFVTSLIPKDSSMRWSRWHAT